MSKTSLSLVKQCARIDGTDLDTALAMWIDAAEEQCEMYCDRDFGTPLPASVTNAVVVYVRAMRDEDMLSKDALMAFERCLQPLRSYDGYFGAISQTPALAPLDSEEISIGDEWSLVWHWRNEDGTAINVTGYTAVFTLYSGETAVITQAVTITSAVNGEFTNVLTSAQTADLVAGEYWYRLRATSGSGVSITLDRKRVNAQ